MRSNSLALIAVLVLAAALRVLRMIVRWDEITLAYAAYAEPIVQAIAGFHPSALLGSWIGLHPPLWGVIHGALEWVAPLPFLWMGFSVACSTCAVFVVGRVGGWVPALVLATAPVHLLDAAELNNYPLASLAVAALVVCAEGGWLQLALAAIFAGWAHLLTGVGAVGLVLWRSIRLRGPSRLALLSVVVAGLMPIAGGAFRLMGQGSTWAQPEVPTLRWLGFVADTVGPEGWFLVPFVLLGLRGSTRALWVCLVGTLVVAVGLDAAASHQRPYLGLIAPVAAMAVAHTLRRYPRLTWVVVGLCLVRGGRFAADDLGRVSAIISDQERSRGIDLVLSQASPGDTVWLVAPALQADDDKTAFSAVLWRFTPWTSMPMALGGDFEFKDYRYGQPRKVGGLTVHTSTELYPAPFDHIFAKANADGHAVWVVVYDHSPATGLIARIEHVMAPYSVAWQSVGEDQGLGADLVLRVRASL